MKGTPYDSYYHPSPRQADGADFTPPSSTRLKNITVAIVVVLTLMVCGAVIGFGIFKLITLP